MGTTSKRIEGAVEELGGKVKHAAGKLIGNEQMQAEGKATEVKGEGKQAAAKADPLGDEPEQPRRHERAAAGTGRIREDDQAGERKEERRRPFVPGPHAAEDYVRTDASEPHHRVQRPERSARPAGHRRSTPHRHWSASISSPVIRADMSTVGVPPPGWVLPPT